MIDLGVLLDGPDSPTESWAVGINNSGQVVGEYILGSAAHAFLYSGGGMIDLGTLPGGSNTYAVGISESGQVAGWGDTATSTGDAFLYSEGSMLDLSTLPGGSAGIATGVSNSGEVVGSFGVGFVAAALYKGGTISEVTVTPDDAVGVTPPFGAGLPLGVAGARSSTILDSS